MARQPLPAGWKRTGAGSFIRYERADGAAVYDCTGRSSWGGRDWHAYVPQLGAGFTIATTRAEAIAWVEKHYPVGGSK